MAATSLAYGHLIEFREGQWVYADTGEPLKERPCASCCAATITMEVTVPAALSHTGEERQKLIGVDACIAPIVRALNAGGVPTDASCCGHGKAPGNIALADGRELIICEDRETARTVEQRFPPRSRYA